MVWGVEETIPGILGTGINGFEAGKALSNFFSINAPERSQVGTPNQAKIRYLLGTSVPENWIPFIPSRKPGSNRHIRLQRAAMPRLTDAIAKSVIEPRGKILRVHLDAVEGDRTYFVHEEEVPRAGVIVTSTLQRARWFDGKVFTWLGRRKETGRGDGASGLVFDQILPVENGRAEPK